MAVFELPIKSTYVPSWGSWECIREAMQNGLDEADRGHALTVEHTGEYLRIHNRGSSLEVRALIIGHTDKAEDKRMRGTHGEGLGLCFLSGIRAGYAITVHTPSHTWKPSIEFSQAYGEEILMVKTRKKTTQFEGVETRISLPREKWNEVKRLFLSMREVDEKKILHSDRGTILLDGDSRGMLYVKGIFVQKRSDLQYGYDLHDVKLDRDRSIINQWDLHWELGRMYTEAIQRKPEKPVIDRVYGMLQSGAEDVKGMKYYHDMPEEVRDSIAQAFLSEHGETSIPVKDISESESMSHAGRQGVVVSDTLETILKSSKIETVEKIQMQSRNAITSRVSWQDLEEDEQQVLKSASDMIEKALEWATEERCTELFLTNGWTTVRSRILDRVQIVEFLDDKIEGVNEEGIGSMKISRACLKHLARALRVLIHEKAHDSFASAGIALHGRYAEELWTLVHASHGFYANSVLH